MKPSQNGHSQNGHSQNGQFPPHVDRNHLPEAEWEFPHAHIGMYATRPEQIPSWDSQPAEHRKLFARQGENYADFLEHAGYEVGRVIDAIEEIGELDNTLIICILGETPAPKDRW